MHFLNDKRFIVPYESAHLIQHKATEVFLLSIKRPNFNTTGEKRFPEITMRCCDIQK